MARTCPSCGRTIYSDTAICPYCKQPFSNSVNSGQEQLSMPGNSLSRRWINYIGIFIGACCMTAGGFFFWTEPSLKDASFGADFYTYAYRGFLAIERLLIKLIKLWSITLFTSGALIACHFSNENQKLS